MPKVKLLRSRASPTFSQKAGEVIEGSEDEALFLVKNGRAEPVQEQRIEKAVKKNRGRKAVADEAAQQDATDEG